MEYPRSSFFPLQKHIWGVLSLVYLQRPACGDPLQPILPIHNRAYLMHSSHRPREELFVCGPSVLKFNGSWAQCGMKALLFRCLTPYRLASPADNGTFCFVPVWFCAVYWWPVSSKIVLNILLLAWFLFQIYCLCLLIWMWNVLKITL